MFAGDAVGGTKEHIKGTEDISRGQKTAPQTPFSGRLKNLFLYRMYMSTHEAEAVPQRFVSGMSSGSQFALLLGASAPAALWPHCTFDQTSRLLTCSPYTCMPPAAATPCLHPTWRGRSGVVRGEDLADRV